jgi:uncharacterized protein (TIGR03435 family)
MTRVSQALASAALALAAHSFRLSAAQEITSRPESPHFEIASIKPLGADGPHDMGVKVYPGGRVEVSGFPLKQLIVTAFNVAFWQVSGGDEWVSKDEYFLVAKPPEAVQSRIRSLRYTLFGIDDPLLRQMLQALLIDFD